MLPLSELYQHQIHRAPEHRATLVLWPCGGGDATRYALDFPLLEQAGISVVCFNPGGHGRTPGPFSFEHSIEALAQVVEQLPPGPRFGVGHSMGCYGLLRAFHRLQLHHLFWVSPIADSRRSLLFMYETGRIQSFIRLFQTPPEHAEVVQRILATPDWLDATDTLSATLRALEVPTTGAIQQPSFASFAREVFLPGYRLWPLANGLQEHMTAWIATDDRWYPLDELSRDLHDHGIPFQRFAPASDHLFTGAWHALSTDIVARITRSL